MTLRHQTFKSPEVLIEGNNNNSLKFSGDGNELIWGGPSEGVADERNLMAPFSKELCN